MKYIDKLSYLQKNKLIHHKSIIFRNKVRSCTADLDKMIKCLEGLMLTAFLYNLFFNLLSNYFKVMKAYKL